MNQLQRMWVWLRRIGHCRGFGVQSPSDYRFVRYVVNEHAPYYAYAELGEGSDWLHRKVGELLLRLANWLQPVTVVSRMGYDDYLRAGCRSALLTADAGTAAELGCFLAADDEWLRFCDHCGEGAVMVVADIWRYPAAWQRITAHPRVRITFDLYYCGIVMFNPERAVQHYVVNF